MKSVKFQPILFVCGLIEEGEAFLHKLSRYRSFQINEINSRLFEIQDKSTQITVGVLGICKESGNLYSREITEKCLLEYNPQAVILFGITAGIPKRVALEEILITEKVWDLRKGSIEEPYTFSPRPLDSVYAFPLRIKLSLLESRAKRKNSNIKIHLNLVCGSSNYLIRKKDYVDRACDTHRKLGAIEMEGAGVAEVCIEKKIPFLVIKSISDFGDKDKDDIHRSNCLDVVTDLTIQGFLKPLQERYKHNSENEKIIKPDKKKAHILSSRPTVLQTVGPERIIMK